MWGVQTAQGDFLPLGGYVRSFHGHRYGSAEGTAAADWYHLLVYRFKNWGQLQRSLSVFVWICYGAQHGLTMPKQIMAFIMQVFDSIVCSGMEFIRVMQVGAEARGWNCTCLHVTLRIDVVIVVTYINYRFISAFQPCSQVFLGSSSDLCTLQQWRGRPGSSIYVNNVNPWNPSSV